MREAADAAIEARRSESRCPAPDGQSKRASRVSAVGCAAVDGVLRALRDQHAAVRRKRRARRSCPPVAVIAHRLLAPASCGTGATRSPRASSRSRFDDGGEHDLLAVGRPRGLQRRVAPSPVNRPSKPGEAASAVPASQSAAARRRASWTKRCGFEPSSQAFQKRIGIVSNARAVDLSGAAGGFSMLSKSMAPSRRGRHFGPDAPSPAW